MDITDKSKSRHGNPQGDVIELSSNQAPSSRSLRPTPQVSFDRRELSEILRVYGRHVADGEWRDYALDFQRDRAVFSIFKRASEMPVYQVEKNPKLARKQGAYSVINTAGMILKRGHDLRQVLKVLESRRYLRIVD